MGLSRAKEKKKKRKKAFSFPCKRRLQMSERSNDVGQGYIFNGARGRLRKHSRRSAIRCSNGMQQHEGPVEVLHFPIAATLWQLKEEREL